MLLRLLIIGLLLVLAYAVVRKKIGDLRSRKQPDEPGPSRKPGRSAWSQNQAQIRDAKFKDLDG